MVELFGLPGAGKTTLTNRLVLPGEFRRREDLSRALRTQSVPQYVLLALRTLADWRWLLALAILALKTPIWRRESLQRLVRIALQKTWMNSQSGLVVLDQGPLQSLWSIFFTEGVSDPPMSALSRVLRHLYSGIDIAVFEIDVDPGLAARRVDLRDVGNSRLDDLPLGTVRRKLEEVAALPRAIIAAAQATTVTGGSLPW
ncbi:MAG: hypothetical protein EX262_06510, partial [Sphingomonadaceae bacterium]